ncbi:related to integral membrane protein PTH11 [Phialocephala subalpina]|uniref:Related to integral membrane protein PTH11 n=1 Tax=Phialocephala subalpina TaxID=576137 RepID=A0A1L7X0Y1_9HELO|nr:related to integral membrane protein PTH11 [Phialocephala subalpina]
MGSPYQTELWTEYGIGMVIFILRFFARWKVVGFANFAWDDFFAFVAMILWTVDSATVQIINDYGSFVGLNEQTAAALSDETAARYEVGSKALFVAWISRRSLGLWQQKFAKVMGVLSAIAYVAVLLTLFAHCTPIPKNWQVKPYAGDKCTLTVANYIVVATLNVLTDVGILAIPLPLIWRARIPLRRKIIIGLLLSSGVFVITAALLRCILTLASVSQIGNSTIWGIRETFVSLIAISAPAIRPLFNKSRWIGSSDDNGPGSSGFRPFGRNLSVQEISTDVSERDRKGSVTPLSDVELKDLSRHSSDEYIIDSNNGKNVPLEINVTTVYALVDEEWNETSMPSPKLVEEEGEENETGTGKSNNLFRVPTSGTEREWRLRGENITEISVGERTEGSESKASRMLGMGGDS